MQHSIQLPLFGSNKSGMLRQIMYEVFYAIPSVKWTSKLATESGFYGKVKRKYEYFFGMSNEFREHTGIPICLSFKLSGSEGLEKYVLLDTYINLNHKDDLQLLNHNGYAVVQFRDEYFEKEVDVKKIKELIMRLGEVIA